MEHSDLSGVEKAVVWRFFSEKQDPRLISSTTRDPEPTCQLKRRR